MSIKYDFQGNVVLITGAGSGMGLATAQAFAEAGASTVLADLAGPTLDAAAASLLDAGLDVLPVAVNVSDEKQIRDAIAQAVARYGRLDAAFNNAGIMIPPAETADASTDDFDWVVSVNLRGVWLALKHELVQMRSQGYGTIVNCSSIAGLSGAAMRSSYAATKHGIIGLTKSAALEGGPHGVRINAVCPGTITTPMVDRMIASGELDGDASASAAAIPRLGRPDEVAAAVLWLCSSASSYVTGVALPVDGGYGA